MVVGKLTFLLLAVIVIIISSANGQTIDIQEHSNGVALENSHSANSDQDCDRGTCKNKCNCCPGYYLKDGGLFRDNSCESDCKNNPCTNGGQCTISGNDIKCICTHKYAGEFCEKTLSTIETTPSTSTRITETPISATANKIMETAISSTPTIIMETATSSVATNTYEDKATATTKSASCKPNPCKNDGICKVMDNGIKCYCRDFYAGEFCEKIQDCDKGTCKNKCNCCPGYYFKEGSIFRNDSCEKCDCGSDEDSINCTLQISSFQTYIDCSCPTGYTKHASYLCKADCKENPCENDGICMVSGKDIECICADDYIGKYCEKQLSTIETTPSTSTRIMETPISATANKIMETAISLTPTTIMETETSSIATNTYEDKTTATTKSDQDCDRGACKNECNCCSGYYFLHDNYSGKDSCEKCNCGKDYNCSFYKELFGAERKYCHCPDGYTNGFDGCEEAIPTTIMVRETTTLPSTTNTYKDETTTATTSARAFEILIQVMKKFRMKDSESSMNYSYSFRFGHM